MGLINCKECGTEVSSKAHDCPKCGGKLKKRERSIFGKIVKYSFLAFNIIMAFWFISAMGLFVSGGIAAQNPEVQLEGVVTTLAAGLGSVVIIMGWAAGIVILGLWTYLTRAKK